MSKQLPISCNILGYRYNCIRALTIGLIMPLCFPRSGGRKEIPLHFPEQGRGKNRNIETDT